MAKSSAPARKRRTVQRSAPTGPKKAAPKRKPSTSKKTAKKPAEPTEVADAVAEKLVEGVKESLEYELANREIRITVQEKRLTFKSWGLVKEMQYGGRIVALVQRLQGVVEPGSFDSENPNLQLISHLFSLIAEDILDIVAGSISDPFPSHADAYEWIDSECDFKDLFNMAVVIYDQNFKGEKGLGKRMEGLQEAIEGITSLVTSATA